MGRVPLVSTVNQKHLSKRLVCATEPLLNGFSKQTVTFFDERLHGELVGGFLHCSAEGRDVFLLP